MIPEASDLNIFTELSIYKRDQSRRETAEKYINDPEVEQILQDAASDGHFQTALPIRSGEEITARDEIMDLLREHGYHILSYKYDVIVVSWRN